MLTNIKKKYCVVFKPKLYKSSFPEFLNGTKHSNYVDDKNYFGVSLSCDKLDDKDMFPQLRILYGKSIRLLRMFHDGSYKVKLILFRNYCTRFYCATFGSFHQEAIRANNNIDSFETLLRKRTYGIIERLEKSEISIIECLTNSWIIKL